MTSEPPRVERLEVEARDGPTVKPEMIPKLIHQTWSTADLPKQSETLTQRWKQLHSDYAYRLWTDDECREFVRAEYPGFYSTYQAFPSEIQRVDAVRYLILNTFGGIYLDLDMFPLKNLDALTPSSDFMASYEPDEAATRHAREFIVSNAFMASPPQHPFLGKLIEEMKTYKSAAKDGNERILDTTGPLLLSRVYRKHPRGVRALHSQYFMPLYYEQVDAIVSQRNSAEFYRRCHDAYAVHLFEGSWWRKKAPTSYTESLAMPMESSKIPRIIHQTWKSKSLPPRFATLVEQVRALHPDWEMRLWTDDEMLAFVTEHGPQYLPRYTAYKQMIQRCDFFRLFVVSVLGGVYLDLDVQITKSFDDLPGYVEAFFPCEKAMSKDALAAHGNRDAVRIANYAFGAVPQHPLFLYLLGRLNKVAIGRKSLRNKSCDGVIETTGPGILTTAYHDYMKQHPQSNVAILYPAVGASVGCDCGSYAGVAACKIGSFGTHLHAGTWRETSPAPARWSWRKLLMH